jgi:hypothetical protein
MSFAFYSRGCQGGEVHKGVLRIILPTVLLVAAFLFVNLRSLSAPVEQLPYSNDFAHYYLTTSLWLSGSDPYMEPLDGLYQLYELKNRPAINYATNPPALVALFTPLAMLPVKNSYWLWMVLLLVFSALSIALLLKHFRKEYHSLEYLLLLSLLLSSFPFVSNFEVAQVQPFLLFLISLGFVLVHDTSRKSQLVGAMFWGVATALKLFTWPLLYPVVLFWGLPGLITFAFGFVLIHLPFLFQPEIFQSFISQALPQIYQLSSSFYSSVSVSGAIMHSMAIWQIDPGSMEVAKKLMAYLSPLLALIVILFDLLVFNKRGGISSKVCVALIVSCLFVTTGWSHYLVLLAVPLVALYSAACSGKGPINLFEVLILVCLFGFTQGRYVAVDRVWQLVTSWWGVFCMVYMLILVWRYASWQSCYEG